MDYFAVIDVKTNWNNKVMSIGVVIAEKNTLKKLMIYISYLIQNTKSMECFL